MVLATPLSIAAPIAPAGGVRARRSAERRAAIVEAALDLFSEKGFAATRIEDVARRAGVAKGTVYLHFKDKEALFEGIVRAVIMPLLVAVTAVDVSALASVRGAIERVGLPAIGHFVRSRPADVLRLLIAEGPRFPRLALFYHAEVIVPGLALVRRLLRRAAELGELADGPLDRFPQLFVAPLVMGVIWQGLFQRVDPIDLEGMLKAHMQVLFGPGEKARAENS